MAAKKTNRMPDFPYDQDLYPPAPENTAGYRWTPPSPKSRTLTVRITRAGAQSWVTRRNGKSITIGSLEHWSHAQALERDAELNRMIDAGRDPHAEREARDMAPTVADLIALWRRDVYSVVPPKRRPNTMKEYDGMIRQYVMPQLGAKRVTDVTKDDLKQLHWKITFEGKRPKVLPDGTQIGTPTRANHVLALVSALLSFAVGEGLRADNPAKGIARNDETPREREFQGDEFERLLASIAKCRYPQSQRAIKLLLMVGARRSEVLGMKWSEINFAAGIWNKPKTRVKQKKRHYLPLARPALAILLEIKQEQEAKAARHGRQPPEWVLFPSAGRTEHPYVVEIKTTWKNICRRAGITDFRLHDLRHAFASHLVSTGSDLPAIGKLLGHSQVATTEIYAHLNVEAARKDADRYAEFVERVDKARGGEVVPLSTMPRSGVRP